MSEQRITDGKYEEGDREHGADGKVVSVRQGTGKWLRLAPGLEMVDADVQYRANLGHTYVTRPEPPKPISKEVADVLRRCRMYAWGWLVADIDRLLENVEDE